MSHEDELSQIFHKDLTLSKNYLQAKYQDDIGALEGENKRLAEENQALWQCVKSYQENTSLRAANVIGHILSWSERPSISQLSDKSFSQHAARQSKDHPTSPFRPILTAPGINIQTPSQVFQEKKSYILPAEHSNVPVVNIQAPSQVFQEKQSYILPAEPSNIPVVNIQAPSQVFQEKQSYILPGKPSNVPVAESVLTKPSSQQQDSSGSMSSVLYNEVIRTKSPMQPPQTASNIRDPRVKSPHLGPINELGQDQQSNFKFSQHLVDQQNKTTPSNLFQSQKEENNWESLIRKSPVPQNSFFVSQQPTGSDRRSGKSAIGPETIYGDVNSRSEGYGSQMANETGERTVDQSVGQRQVGEPVATSTPIAAKNSGRKKTESPVNRFGSQPEKYQQNQTSPSNTQFQKSGNSILHRPIDPVIGFVPVLSEDRRLKLAQIKPSKRLIGEIAFQLDRRILEFVFSWQASGKSPKRRRYYGYSIANIGQMIRREASDVTGEYNQTKELEMRYRFDYIIRTLTKFGYSLEQHSAFSQDMVNKYGLLSGPPDQKTVKNFGLEDPVILRVLLGQLIQDIQELENELILLDCLCLLAYDDKKPLFAW